MSKADVELARFQVRKVFDRFLTRIEGGGFRVIPDSEVAIALRKEGRYLAGNDERVFVFADEFITGFVAKTYPGFSADEQAELVTALKEQL